MQCAISGSVPQEAVVSKTGYIFERRLLESIVDETGKCPVSGEPLTRDDIMPIKSTKNEDSSHSTNDAWSDQNAQQAKVFKTPRSVAAASLPQMLGQFQDEWDAIVLETHKLKQDLETCQQELSQALYQHDAACRVIARLQRERDEARDKLQDLESVMLETVRKQALKRAAQEQPFSQDNVSLARPKKPKTGITPQILNVITTSMEELSNWRRAKKYVPANLAKPERIRNYKPKKIYNVFESGVAGFMDFHENQENIVVMSGGKGNTHIFDLTQEKVVQELEVGSKCKQVKFVTDKTLLVAGEDAGCRVITQDAQTQQYKVQAVIADDDNQQAVSDMCCHPCGLYYVNAYNDGRWSFNDVQQEQCLATFSLAQADPQSAGSGYLCSGFHPDGLIFALGCNNKEVHLWEMRNRALAARFQGHDGNPVCVAFSENGIHMATSDDQGSLLLWDLRKFKFFHKIVPYQGTPALNLAYDKSGRYLACTGIDSTKIFGVKQDYGLLCGQQGLRSPGGIGLKFQAAAQQLIVGGGAGELMVLAEPQLAASA